MLFLAGLTMNACGGAEPSAPPSLKSIPVLSFAPTTPAEWQIHLSEVATVICEVKNNTKVTLTFAMTPVQGVVRYSGDTGACSPPLALMYQESCLLTTHLTASQLPAKIRGGPPRVYVRTAGSVQPTHDVRRVEHHATGFLRASAPFARPRTDPSRNWTPGTDKISSQIACSGNAGSENAPLLAAVRTGGFTTKPLDALTGDDRDHQ